MITKKKKMVDKVLLVFLCLVISEALARQSPPKIPENFSSMAEVIENDSGIISPGMSTMYQQANKKFLFNVFVAKNDSKNNPVEVTLERFDLKKAYDIECYKLNSTNLNCTKCQESPIGPDDNAQKAGFWTWANETSYIGQRESKNALVDLWQIMFPTPSILVTWTIGVLPKDYNSPKLFEIMVDTGHADQVYNMTFYFTSFDSSMPPDSVFDVPKSCDSSTKSTAVSHVQLGDNNPAIRTPVTETITQYLKYFPNSRYWKKY